MKITTELSIEIVEQNVSQDTKASATNVITNTALADTHYRIGLLSKGTRAFAQVRTYGID